MKLLLRTVSNYSFIITDELRDQLVKAARKGEKVFVMPTGEVVPLTPFPTIVTLERARTADTDWLAGGNKYRCRYGTVHQRTGYGCTCRESIMREDDDHNVDVFSHWIEDDQLSQESINRIKEIRQSRLSYVPRLEQGDVSVMTENKIV